MTESKLWERLMKAWNGHGVRIEASEGGCDPGTPDGNLSLDGRGLWLELKVWPTPCSPIQITWHVDAIQRGATCLVLCHVSDGCMWIGEAEAYQRYIKEKRAPVNERFKEMKDIVSYLRLRLG